MPTATVQCSVLASICASVIRVQSRALSPVDVVSHTAAAAVGKADADDAAPSIQQHTAVAVQRSDLSVARTRVLPAPRNLARNGTT